MKTATKTLSTKQKWLLTLLFLVPALLIVGKFSVLPTHEFLQQWFSFKHLSTASMHRLQYVLFVPLAAVVVVFFRLTLGIRLLGPFRSILIAVAFKMTGIVPGLLFLVLTVGFIVAIRPSLRTLRLPYFARISIMLSAVSLVMIAVILGCEWMDLPLADRVAYFPLVVICLTAEGFARTLAKEGSKSAVWRGGMTAFVAVLIALISEQSHVANLLLHFPELLLVQVGVILFIAQFLNLRLLKNLNPTAKQRMLAGKAKAVVPLTNTLGTKDLDEAEEQTQTL
ncbi:MAG: hypothetical protein JWM68_5398 [Verrucomicrobiales bacterium]|nr:hypothetical protein [Verrucomicrobiales bacterium]